MRDVQPDHRDGPARAEHDLCGLRVSQDVELGARGHVARVVRSAHQSDATHAFHKLRVHAGEQGDVGQRARRDDGYGTRFVVADDVRDEVHRVARILGGAGGGQLGAVQAAVSVDLLGDDLRRDQRPIRPGGERNASDVADPRQCQGVFGDLL